MTSSPSGPMSPLQLVGTAATSSLATEQKSYRQQQKYRQKKNKDNSETRTTGFVQSTYHIFLYTLFQARTYIFIYANIYKK